MKELSEKEFFTGFSQEVHEAYLKSEIYQKFGKKEWGYGISVTRLSKGVPMICGYNWGVGQEWREDQLNSGIQNVYPEQTFTELETMGSYKRIISHFEEYIPEALQGIFCYYCFFRSEYEHQITSGDLHLCDPLFNKLVEYTSPSCIITFSNALKNYLQLEGRLRKMDEVGFKSGRRSVRVSRGKVICGDRLVDFYKLPHPNFPTVADAREKAWKFCFGSN